MPLGPLHDRGGGNSRGQQCSATAAGTPAHSKLGLVVEVVVVIVLVVVEVAVVVVVMVIVLQGTGSKGPS